MALGTLGAALTYRGITGRCSLYRALGIDAKRGKQGKVESETSITINKPADELYRFWRNFENLPRFMKHLKSVTKKSNGRSHWEAEGPMGRRVEWDAEILDEREGELLSWRSLPGADVASHGEVRFNDAGNGQGTVARVKFSYEPPVGALGATLAKLSGNAPERQIKSDLARFKQLMETGEIATNEGQPHGRRSALGRTLSPKS